MNSYALSCYLSDRDANALCPAEPGAIVYKDLSAPGCYGEQPVQLRTGQWAVFTTAAVLIEGCVTVLADGGRISRTVLFRKVQTVLLPFQPMGPLCFETLDFNCGAGDAGVSGPSCNGCAEILIRLESGVSPTPDCGHMGARYNCAERTVFRSSVCMPFCLLPLPFRVHQYHALGDGKKRVFTDADGLGMYGSAGILPPDGVSFCRLFVNGVLQPDSLYELKRGRLEFRTEDVPPAGAPVSILYGALPCGCGLHMESGYYVTASDGVRSRYTDEDGWPAYGGGIPDPGRVSCWNLFVDGVLQPQTVYRIEKGALELCEAPVRGGTVVLEYLRVLDCFGYPLRGSVDQYVAFSRGGRLFTDADAERLYRSSGIILPYFCSYQSVFVNGVIQPEPTYRTGYGRLAFVTDDAPFPGQPVTQQTVSVFL